MILRNPREPISGEVPENAFEAVEERSGERLGASVVHLETNPVLFSNRPVQMRLEFEGQGAAIGQLVGAAIARARAIAKEEQLPARLYAPCAPEDQELLSALAPYGFQDTDGLVRMSLKRPLPPMTTTPAGCVIVNDDLSDPEERTYFLERYNQLYQAQRDVSWLVELSGRKLFQRLLCVSPKGLAGEILLYLSDGAGRVAYLQTSRRWRNMGMGTHMLMLACNYFENLGIYTVEADVRARIPFLLRTFERAGFRQEKLLMRYPGIDIAP
ncbi:MAG TPA: GNAT family N-acetyltransferase [Candidatus Pullichristensenella excrementigallinarum]|uniref:GNAT family N-acetyltransferase n=1 Tax=Candidatus Pullichristensenella excrementigallinarum TaxID=2840907 RepID=A0A9D1IDE5_9FIRM|nr:GNAT family N-acetyltransferase [Candidatus Pullichristensenella excrementigallinarum]